MQALAGVDLTIASGSFAAVMGPSGSGKTTLLHCLAGLDTISGGRVVLDGYDLATLDDNRRTILRRDRVGFIFQAYNLLPVLSARENILLPEDLGGPKIDRAYSEWLIQRLGIGDRLDHRPGQLSGGQQQRVAIARALATRPAVVFADEPTGALDRRTSEQLIDLLRGIVDDAGQTLVTVTHDPSVASYADRAVFLRDGRVAADVGAPDYAMITTMLRDLELADPLVRHRATTATGR